MEGSGRAGGGKGEENLMAGFLQPVRNPVCS
jgi:hypothetical protein